jgi:hypothetical protein
MTKINYCCGDLNQGGWCPVQRGRADLVAEEAKGSSNLPPLFTIFSCSPSLAFDID